VYDTTTAATLHTVASWSLLCTVGLLGLAIGSFLNVVIHRVPLGHSLVSPGSHCPACESPVQARHNVPVLGWLVLRGRCASCRVRISARYPLVELGTGVLFVLVALRFGFTPELPAFLYLAAIAVALTAIDLDVKRLPDAIVLPSYVVGVALLTPAVVVDSDGTAALRGLVGAVVLGGGYLLLALVKPGGMGLGDVKLAGLLGLYLGVLGWSALAVGGFGAFLLGGLAGLALLSTRRAGRRTAVPFGPFMLSAAVLALFVAAPISQWYLGLFQHATV
jgi:leader peptidase (prepilin peptidase) / N-methyltransferase